jgi:hypothetical protein
MIDCHCAILRGERIVPINAPENTMSPRYSAGKWVIGLLVAVACALAGCEAEVESEAVALPYAREFPAVGYATLVPGGAAGRLAGRIASGDARLTWSGERGYLDSLLQELAIDPSSQALVFSRTSLQVRQILPGTPRAIYFNDESYVAWVPGARALEIASYDPELGPVFYTLLQDTDTEPAMERELARCLRCHDTYSLSGGGVPRFLLGSGYTGTDGELVSHEAWILTSQATPLRSRWGGWYVTGTHGDQVHLGNIVVEQAEDLQDLEALRVGNVADLGGLLDTGQYLTPFSDIVALLVLEHQVEVQNRISRLLFESADIEPGQASSVLAEPIEDLVRAMLMIDAVGLSAPVAGGSGFAELFESRGPFDAVGRSLRQLDLETRLFRYPLSYLIYSDGFAALPEPVRDAILGRIDEILDADPATDGFSSLTGPDREAIREILTATLPAFAAI